MNHFHDTVAIVTGGASGIGRALCVELSRKGAHVVVADVDADKAAQVAAGITHSGGQARAVPLDVTQAAAVDRVVEETSSALGQLDFMFNNAGLGVAGEVRDLELEHWGLVLDVNLWGVIYGTTSAYKLMVRQGSGHIVNTASAGGLIPQPMATPYATSKYAVVGLSTSLRAEAAGLGVKVSVVCPGLIQTGILDATLFVRVGREAMVSRLNSIPKMDVAHCARRILRGVERNQAIIVVTGLARLVWWLYRLQPGLLEPLYRMTVRGFRTLRSEP